MQRLRELAAKTSSAETSINNNSQCATHDTKEVFCEGSHDTKEDSHDMKEGSHDMKEGPCDAKDGSLDTKEGSHDTKEGSHGTKESSHDSCGPAAVVIANENEDHKNNENMQENRTANEEQNTTNANVDLDGQEIINSEEVENDGQDTSPSTPLPAVSNAIGSGLYIVGMHRKMVSNYNAC